MDSMLLIFVILAGSYIIGSIPFGLIITWLSTGKDVRSIASGRTGGTNVMRAAGFWAGLGTAIMDILKSAASVWVAKSLVPENVWIQIAAPLLVILGHNYSIFLIERLEDGKIRWRGGAGGASCVGGSVGIWAPSIFVILPLGIAILYFGGYASVATMSVAILSAILFAVRAGMGISPWIYSIYGIVAFVLLAWSLRPNIMRLINGTERVVGFRARQKKDDQG